MVTKDGLNFTILIATKDRPKELTLLLESITKSTVLPSKLVIVFSGTDINEIVVKYTSILNIELIRSEVASQIFQKSKGIESLKFNEGWVLFLDDDVLIGTKTVEILVKKYIDNDEYSKYAGFGLAISGINYRNLNLLSRFFLSVFKLYSSIPGTITKSGHPQSYLNQKSNCDVLWLNGISLWRSDVLQTYVNSDLIVDHSSYEDVIFSYSVSKRFKLHFLSDVIVTNQVQTAPQITGLREFIHGSYLRYYFVSENKEFSKYWLLVSQVLRNIDYVFLTKGNFGFFVRAKVAMDIWLSLFHATMKKVSGKELIYIKLKRSN